MKLSLTWLFDHLHGDCRTVDVPQLVDTFNKKVAAIEYFEPFNFSVAHMSLARIKNIADEMVTVFSLEWQKTIELPRRPDAAVGNLFLVKILEPVGYAWVTLGDCGSSTKEILFPAIYCPKGQQAGGWKKFVETDDYILELDNPSVTHRPDLWGMRGVARECAAILNFKMRSLDQLLQKTPVTVLEHNKYQGAESGGPVFTISNDAPTACTRFASAVLTDITAHACALPVAFRLCRIDHRPINALVDATNYVMLDLGQPLHAFDAKKITTNHVSVRLAHAGESLTLLDGAQLKLSQHDLVIADGERAMSLAGVMGGRDTSVSATTTQVFIESAHFDSSVIRRTSSRYRLRTDASARFEKGLNPNQITDAIQRLYKLLKQTKISFKTTGSIIVLGTPVQSREITLTHQFIEDRLGTTITARQVQQLLKSIGFGVRKRRDTYHVQVPLFRGTSSITIAEDIVEEVGRLLGWDTIVPVLPPWQMMPHDTREPMVRRAVKQELAFALCMHEVQNYPFFDERFLQAINWQPTNAVCAKNPLSLNMTRLVTSLVPHLLMNVQHNMHKHGALRFFECNRVWHLTTETDADEQQACAGALWHTKDDMDFYTGKRELSLLFDSLEIAVSWNKCEKSPAPWYNLFQTAELRIGDQILGYAGMNDRAFVHDQIPGCGFIFELSMAMLIEFAYPIKRFAPLCKYPYVYLDVSIFIAAQHTVAELERVIRAVDQRIYDVSLIDMFAKDTQPDQCALTFRFYMRDQQQTLTKHDANIINTNVIQALKDRGAEIR